MTYACLTTKHHDGFCIWDSKTTTQDVASNPFKRNIVKEYSDTFRKNGLKVLFYFSTLDLNVEIRPRFIKKEHLSFIKEQLTELLTNYGDITAIIFDGRDAPWSRIS
jgi:alpha-L-fucosidase